MCRRSHSVGKTSPSARASRSSTREKSSTPPASTFSRCIDAHTHLDIALGGSNVPDDFETGTTAAAFGGTTTIVDFAIQYRVRTWRTAFDSDEKPMTRRQRLTPSIWHHDRRPDARLPTRCRTGAPKVSPASSFFFIGLPGSSMLDDASILKGATSAKNGAMSAMHAENGGATT